MISLFPIAIKLIGHIAAQFQDLPIYKRGSVIFYYQFNGSEHGQIQ